MLEFYWGVVALSGAVLGVCGLLGLLRKRIVAFFKRLYYRLYEWLEERL